MKWLLILLCIIGFYSSIIGFYSNSYGQDNKEVYYGTWKGESQFITTEIIFKDSGGVQVTFTVPNKSQYIERTGGWKVNKKIVELFLNYEETQDYMLNIKNMNKCYKHKFTLIGINKGLLIDDNTSTYMVYKILDKKEKRVKHLKKKI